VLSRYLPGCYSCGFHDAFRAERTKSWTRAHELRASVDKQLSHSILVSVLTQHRTFGGLHASLVTDVTGNTQENNGIVFCRVCAWCETSNHMDAATKMQIDRPVLKSRSQQGKWEGLSGDLAPIQFEACSNQYEALYSKKKTRN